MAKGKKASVKKSSSMGSRKLKSKQSQKSDNISTTEEFNRILNSDTQLKGKKKSKKASKKNSKQEHPSTIRSFFNGMGNNMMGMQQQPMQNPMMGMQQPMMGEGNIMGQLHNQMGVNQNGGFNLKNLANLSSTTILK